MEPWQKPAVRAYRTVWSWRIVISWPTLVILGFLIYEVTAQAAFSICLLCFKASGPDFKTAIWLKRNDPWQERGAACFWLYSAAGLGQAAAIAFLIACALPFFVRNAANGRDNFARQLLEAGVTAGVGLYGAAFAGFRALYLANKNDLRLWLGGGVHSFRRLNLWPPGNCNVRWLNKNELKSVVALASCAVILLFPVAYLVILYGVPVVAEGWLFSIFLLLFVPALAFVHWLDKVTERRFLAATPMECWHSRKQLKRTNTLFGDEFTTEP